MVRQRTWIFSISLLVITAGVPLTTVQADVTIPSHPIVDEAVDGVYLVDILEEELSFNHAPGSPERISWSHEPGDRALGQAYRFKVQVVAVDDGEVDQEHRVGCGFEFLGTQRVCSFDIREMPIEPGFYDIHVQTITGPVVGIAVNPLIGGEELCDETRGFFQPCDVVRVRVLEPHTNIEVYEVCTQLDGQLDHSCVGHPAILSNQVTVDVPAEEDVWLTAHPGGITRSSAEVDGNVSITGDLRCVSGQVTCTDLSGDEAEAVHTWYSQGTDSEGRYTGISPLVAANGPAQGTCSDFEILIDAFGDGLQDTDRGVLTLCGV